jgi:DNA invertase Pin-like site-specific DNA recombinase
MSNSDQIPSSRSKLLLSVMGAFAEFDHALLRERQREGIAIAKKARVYKGRKPSLTPERAKELRTRIAGGEEKAALAREFGISRETLYQYEPVGYTRDLVRVSSGTGRQPLMSGLCDGSCDRRTALANCYFERRR